MSDWSFVAALAIYMGIPCLFLGWLAWWALREK